VSAPIGHAFRPGSVEHGHERQCSVTAPDGLRHCGYPPEVHEDPTKIVRFRSSGIRTFRIGSVEVTVAHSTSRRTEEGTDEDALVGQVAEWCRDSVTQFARADATARHNAAKWESTKADLFAKIDRLQAQLHAERERHPERPHGHCRDTRREER